MREKYGTTKQATDDNIKRRTCLWYWVAKATDKNSEYVTLLYFHENNGHANAYRRFVAMHTACLWLCRMVKGTRRFEISNDFQSFYFNRTAWPPMTKALRSQEARNLQPP
jgi:hypothetical protein